jgi:hypothetical protein
MAASDIVSTSSNDITPGIQLKKDGNYQLQTNSILIDRGSEKGCVGPEQIPLASDLEGNPRISDGDGDGVRRCDIGALEQVRH